MFARGVPMGNSSKNARVAATSSALPKPKHGSNRENRNGALGALYLAKMAQHRISAAAEAISPTILPLRMFMVIPVGSWVDTSQAQELWEHQVMFLLPEQ